MDFNALLSERRVIVHSDAQTWQDVLRQIGATFTAPDEVTDGFVDALLTREANYPTGLPVSPFGVALPHADGVYVREPGLALCTLVNDVAFQQMGTPDVSVPVRFAVCIALPEEKREEQAVLLGQLIDRIQDGDRIERALRANSAADVIRAFAGA